MPKIVDLLETYAQGVTIQPSTIATYVGYVRALAVWLDEGEAEVEDMHADLLAAYQADLVRRLRPKTVSLHLSAIRSFCRWCIRQRLATTDPTLALTWPVTPRRPPRALRPAELAALHAALQLEPAGDRRRLRHYWRNRRAIYILLYAGLRLGELARLTWADVDLSGRALWVLAGKGDKDRVIAISDALAEELERVPVDDRVGAVCGQKDGRTIGLKSLAHLFERWLPVEQGGPRISAHRLRHSCATEMLLNGADLEAIRRQLGHESLETTQIYLMCDPGRLRDAVNRIPKPPGIIRRVAV